MRFKLNPLAPNGISVADEESKTVQHTSIGTRGADGANGVGVVSGGSTGQVLAKKSNTDYDTEWTTVAGTGDVVGPASSTDGNVVLFDGITGKLIKDSGLTLSGTNTGDQVIPDSIDDLGPSQTGNNGKFLKTDGTNASWESIPGGGDMLASVYDPAGGAKQVAFADAIPTQYTDEMAQDAVGGMVDSTLTYTDGTPELKVSNPVTPAATGFTITAGTTPKTLTVSDTATITGTNTGDQDLSGYVPTSRTVNSKALTGNITLTQDDIGDGTTYKQYSATEQSKLAGIADGATANTGTVTSVAATVPTGMTVSGSPVTTTGTLALGYDTGYQGYTTTEASKLSGIETGADVTDATNVDAAGATMNSDTTLVGNSYFLDEDNMASDSATKVASQQSIKAYVDAAITATKSALFPVGAIYASTVSTNPGTLLGFGTWAAYGAGRVMVGKAASGTFATGGATGGAETHTLTTAEMPTHSHGMPKRPKWFGSDGGSNTGEIYSQQSTTWQAFDWNTNNAGSGSAHNNLQPYIVTYLWERTA